MKSFKNFQNQVITNSQAIKGGDFIRRGKIKQKQTEGYAEVPSFAVAANGKGTKQSATRASGKPQLL